MLVSDEGSGAESRLAPCSACPISLLVSRMASLAFDVSRQDSGTLK